MAGSPWTGTRTPFAPWRIPIVSAGARARTRYRAPWPRTSNPPARGSISMSRRSPSISRRNRMASSRELRLASRERPFRGRRPFDGERRPHGETVRGNQGRGDRRNPFLPRPAASNLFRDPQVRDHRRPEVPAGERARPKDRPVERKIRVDAANLERVDGARHQLDRQRPASAVQNELRDERAVEWRGHRTLGARPAHPQARALPRAG